MNNGSAAITLFDKKRIYLLSILFISLLLPLNNITKYVELHK